MAKKYKNSYNVEEVMEMTELSRTMAYDLIRKLNTELEAKGKLTFPGRVHKDYFNERYYGAAKTA